MGKDVVHLAHRVDVLIAPVQEILPLVSHNLQTEAHTLMITLEQCLWDGTKDQTTGLEFRNWK